MIKFTSDVESPTEHLDLWEVAGICSEQAESPTTHMHQYPRGRRRRSKMVESQCASQSMHRF